MRWPLANVVLLAAGSGCVPLPRSDASIGASNRSHPQGPQAEARLAVRVLDREGRPLRDYTVQVRAHVAQHGGYSVSGVRPVVVRGAVDGECTVAGVHPGGYVLRVTADGFAKSHSDPFFVPEDLREPIALQVTMNQGGEIHGVITDELGKPIVGATVWTFAKGDPEPGSRLGITSDATETRVQTNNRGEFRLRLLAPYYYQVRIDDARYARVYLTGIEVREGQTVDTGTSKLLIEPIKLPAGGWIQGIVLLDGMPKPAAKVTLSSSRVINGQGVFDTTLTNEKGEFTFKRRLAPGQYELHATRTDYANPLLALRDIAKSRQVVTVPRGTQRITIQLSSR